MEKYYTLEFDDLIYGLECEIKTKGEWKKWTFNSESKLLNLINILLLAKNIKYGEVRCKYLDKDDIESLGFKCKNPRLYKLNEEYELFPLGDNKILIREILTESNFNKRLDNKQAVYCQLFNGIIKNKAELKRIMKMIEII